MGLDIVEVMMAIEDEFEIKIPDDSYPDLTTVGDMYRYILERLAERGVLTDAPSTCPSLPAFLSVRRALQHCTDFDRQRIRPRTMLNDIIPRQNRRELWQQLQDRLEHELPPLVRPASVTWAARLAALVLGTAKGVPGFQLFGIPGALTAIPVVYHALKAADAATRRYEVEFSGISTVGDLVWQIRIDSQASHARRLTEFSRGKVWDRLVHVVSCQLQVPGNLIRPDSRWVEDLCC